MLKKGKVEFLDKSEKQKCFRCEGKGWHRERDVAEDCDTCGGDGVFERKNYHLVATKPSGQKIAFSVDGFK